MKALEMSFKGTDKRVKHLRLKYINTDLKPKEIEALMAKIAAARLFVKDGGDLYAEPVSADMIETTKTSLVAPVVPAPTV